MATVKLVHLQIDPWQEDEWVGVAANYNAAKRLAQTHLDEAAKCRIGIDHVSLKWEATSQNRWRSVNGPYDGFRITTVTLHE